VLVNISLWFIFLCFALSLCFVLVIDLFVFSVGFHWVHTTFVLGLLCNWHWTCIVGLCIFFCHWSSYVFFNFCLVTFFHLFHYWFVYLYYFSFFIFYFDALCFFLILSFLFQTLFNCNASLICPFSYCIFWCCYFLVGFCKWFVTIFITSHGSIAILLTSFVLLLWMTHKCLAQLGVLPFSLSYFNLSLYKSQHSSFGLWWSICKFHTKDRSISTHCNFCNLFFACPLFVNS
jgi:hypothetical protein